MAGLPKADAHIDNAECLELVGISRSDAAGRAADKADIATPSQLPNSSHSFRRATADAKRRDPEADCTSPVVLSLYLQNYGLEDKP